MKSLQVTNVFDHIIQLSKLQNPPRPQQSSVSSIRTCIPFLTAQLSSVKAPRRPEEAAGATARARREATRWSGGAKRTSREAFGGTRTEFPWRVGRRVLGAGTGTCEEAAEQKEAR